MANANSKGFQVTGYLGCKDRVEPVAIRRTQAGVSDSNDDRDEFQ